MVQVVADVSTDVLVVGTGPAGASLAAFLAYHGVFATIINKEQSTSLEPRAHVTNMATMECIRDIDLEKEFLEKWNDYTRMPARRYCHTITGQEYFRSQIVNQVPSQKFEFETAGPCRHLDIAQNLAEPILVKHGILTTCRDLETGKLIHIQCRFLCGAEGGRSSMVRHIGAKLTGPREEFDTCYSITFAAELSKIFAQNDIFMSLMIQPDKPINPHAIACSLRAIQPWNQFQLIAIPAPGSEPLSNLDEVDWKKLITDMIGISELDMQIQIKSRWRVNEVVADFYSKGNVFCLGDAVHRHPPANGLGSNTSIQDAYNLAWKLSYILKGIASPKLLDTYSIERQPVGWQAVKRANDSWRVDAALFSALGMVEPDLEKRRKTFKMLGEDNTQGRQLREKLDEAFKNTEFQFAAIGAEMNQLYQSQAIFVNDEDPDDRSPTYHNDKDLHYIRGTIPGMRLPHAWLTTNILGKVVSTQDLAGKGRFTIFTGIGGKDIWADAAANASKAFCGLEIAVFSIGWGQDYMDTDFMWKTVCGIEEDGAVLVRPDRFVCWRSKTRLSPEHASRKLEVVFKQVLGW